ncbi:KpsF/GutQ family sugar-phosphate isomerase [Cytophagales bacterium LB-30]|uniref:KpsF/GutQ family sugar-phosphate isomerase n=1 Tax=Shiella aurantiaca TaxID=3058365 RepID=A0ABT8F7E5_9BACT|nr:KpsF/GutQ family sugar-phosphate isomerase [Shiella aurantiaca]MDN4166402.1 KpsF/GutQ family sugar-phosphate isomerase [Shiella aurantiaca]
MNLIKNIKQIARDTLINEADAVRKIADLVDDSFVQCVEAILACKGRVVITGIGKSAIIANKIVATLNSTGTPALFMHAADAIHGDLGMVQKDDIVICISKSGNTPEIKVLVPLLKRTGSQLVALVSNTDSYLAQQADFILNATIGAEACPNNLAPTTSTTAHLALGDALAVSLLECRGFSSEDFARYHPGGSLGKQLYLKVDDIFKNNACPKVSPDTSAKEVIIEISSNRLGAAAVVNAAGELVGVITDGDLRRMMQKSINFDQVQAKDIMGTSPKTIESGAFAVKALHTMQDNNISQLIVVDGKQPVGFVHLHDLLKEGII